MENSIVVFLKVFNFYFIQDMHFLIFPHQLQLLDRIKFLGNKEFSANIFIVCHVNVYFDILWPDKIY